MYNNINKYLLSRFPTHFSYLPTYIPNDIYKINQYLSYIYSKIICIRIMILQTSTQVEEDNFIKEFNLNTNLFCYILYIKYDGTYIQVGYVI